MPDVSGGTDLWAGLIDIPFGAVLLGCALWLRTVPGVHHYWVLTTGFGGVSALLGAAYHLVLQDPDWLATTSWVVTAVLLIIALSYMLAASAMDVLGPEPTRIVLVVRTVGLAAYLVAVCFGYTGTGPLVTCEALTMAGIVGMWCYAAYTGHPRGRPMVTGILVSALSSACFIVPADTWAEIDLTAGAVSHLVQIPGFILISRAAATKLDERPSTATAEVLRPQPAV